MISKKSLIISWIAQIVAIFIMGQSLYYKFTAHPDSVAIFTDINMEPFGRILIGVIELIACLLLIRNSTAPWGALLGFGTMAGAVVGHSTQIGWDGARGQLGMLAVLVLIACSLVLYIRRMQLPFISHALTESTKTKTN